MDTLLTARQVEELLNVDRTTIYRMLKDGRLNGVKIGQHWRFTLQEVEELLSGNVTSTDKDRPANTDALPVHCMQPVQDVFAEIAQVGAVTTNHQGQPLTRVSNACDFCKLILGSEQGRQACIHSWKLLVEQEKNAPEFTTCHAGLQYARARIEHGGKLLAIIVMGQFHLEAQEAEKENEKLAGLAQKYHIDLEILKQAARKVTILEARNSQQISGWLERVANTFEQISAERADLMNRLKQISMMSEI